MARRIAVITDVHANLPALDAAMAEIDALGCDEIIHTGDAVGIGPFPAETLERLLSTPRLRLVMGNHDAWFANDLHLTPPAWVSAGELAHHTWVNAQLPSELKRAVAAWPYSITEDLAGTRVVFTHYARPDLQGGFATIVREPSPEDMDELFEGTGPGIIFHGHHHPKSDLTGRSRYVNPGALGCHDVPVARFAVLDVAADGAWEIAFHEAAYDPEPVIAALEEREIPDRDLIRQAFLRFAIPKGRT